MDDLIRRKDAIDALGEEPLVWDEWKDEYTLGMRAEWTLAKRDIESLPSIDAVKHGRWVPGREIGKEILTDGTIEVVYEDYKCSSCGRILYRLLHDIDGTPFYKFCPNCGAKMDETVDE